MYFVVLSMSITDQLDLADARAPDDRFGVDGELTTHRASGLSAEGACSVRTPRRSPNCDATSRAAHHASRRRVRPQTQLAGSGVVSWSAGSAQEEWRGKRAIHDDLQGRNALRHVDLACLAR